ncbi:MAG: hypothetical protein DRO88_00735 [Promethearchaeia archaeon]|nr:MAG: hypothetical protein DRO88_00735 [Candidatus Lokiarchaeia archaeon]
MGFTVEQFVLLITFSLIYLVFLCYDLFKRGDNYGSIAYIAALLPANYLWSILTKNNMLDFGPIGAMMVLAILWLLAVIRDIIIKDREQGYKDADDVALMLIVGIILNLILSAVLPALPGLEHMKLGTTPVLKFFYIPIFDLETSGHALFGVILAYKILITLLTLSVIIPIVMDLKDMETNLVALVILTLIFGIPFSFLAFLWSPATSTIWVFLFLFMVLFFIFLLLITRGKKK